MLMYPKSTANIFIIWLTLYDLYLVPFPQYLEADNMPSNIFLSFSG